MNKIQCQFGQFYQQEKQEDPVIPRCPKIATRKFGDFWFCEEHGKREAKTEKTEKTEKTVNQKSFKSKQDDVIQAIRQCLEPQAVIFHDGSMDDVCFPSCRLCHLEKALKELDSY